MSRDSPNRRASRSRRNSGDHFTEDFSRMLVLRDQEFNAKQDSLAEQLQREHLEELERAQWKHASVREDACETLEEWKKRQQFYEQQQLESKRRKQAAAEEDLRRQAETAARQALDAQKRKEEEERRIQETLRQAEVLRMKNEEAEAQRHKREAVAAEAQKHAPAHAAFSRAQQAPPEVVRVPIQNGFTKGQTAPSPAQYSRIPAAQSAPIGNPTPTAPAIAVPTAASLGITSTTQVREAVHNRYLQVHQLLKQTRVSMRRGGTSLKEWTERKRVFKKAFGQLANDKDPHLSDAERLKVTRANGAKRVEMITALKEALQAPGPKLAIKNYIAVPQTDANLDDSSAQVPMVFIYLLNMCAKAAINTVKNTQPSVIETVGITTAFVFGALDLRYQGKEPFIDILLAKYHRVCPILFGIYGSEDTEKGRKKLGWRYDLDDNDRIAWVDEKTHFEEQQYLATGWATITLRDFSKAKASRNACPPWNYWRSVAMIVNTPPEHVTRTHLVVLKHLLATHADKFIKFYGQAATAVLRLAVVEFPAKQGEKRTTERTGLEFLREQLSTGEWKIRL